MATCALCHYLSLQKCVKKWQHPSLGCELDFLNLLYLLLPGCFCCTLYVETYTGKLYVVCDVDCDTIV